MNFEAELYYFGEKRDGNEEKLATKVTSTGQRKTDILGLRLELEVDECTDERWELGVTLAGAGCGVDGCLRVGKLAACVGKLGTEAGTIVVIESESFFLRVVVGDVIELAMETLLVGQAVQLCGLEDLRSTMAGFTPAVMVGKFVARCRSLVPIARMADGISFLPSFEDDATRLVAVFLLSVDDALAGEGSVDLTDGVF